MYSIAISSQYGFTLDRTVNDAINPYLEAHTDTCFLNETDSGFPSPQHPAIVFLKMDFKRLKYVYNRSPSLLI